MYFLFVYFFSEKTSLDISCESSAGADDSRELLRLVLSGIIIIIIIIIIIKRMSFATNLAWCFKGL